MSKREPTNATHGERWKIVLGGNECKTWFLMPYKNGSTYKYNT